MLFTRYGLDVRGIRFGFCLSLILITYSLAVGAENRALIMGIADYGQQDDLPGVSQDVALARAMAHTLGIPAANIETRNDRQLTLQGMRQSFERLIAETDEDAHA